MAVEEKEKTTPDTTETVDTGPSLKERFETRATESQGNINKVYDDNINQQRQGLLNAFNQNMADQNTQRENIQKSYASGLYDVGVQNDRNDTGLTNFANVRGLNYQGGSQHQLALNNARNKANTKLNFSMQNAMEEQARQAQLAETNYQNQVRQALADNDYKRAAALMDDYNNQNAWREKQAEILSTYGRFDEYANLYGKDTADEMEKIWRAQNPDAAYRMGDLTPEEYKNITGRYPRGYHPPVNILALLGAAGALAGGPRDDGSTASLYGVNGASAGKPLMPPVNWDRYHTQ